VIDFFITTSIVPSLQ